LFHGRYAKPGLDGGEVARSCYRGGGLAEVSVVTSVERAADPDTGWFWAWIASLLALVAAGGVATSASTGVETGAITLVSVASGCLALETFRRGRLA
jgi:hypothetical protein